MASYSAQVTENNPDLHQLKVSWDTARFTADDGIGPLESLHQAGDSIVAVTRITDAGSVVLGSGVMIAPGILLTATHVLDEFPREGAPPAFMTFLRDGARVWLPMDLANTARPSSFYDGNKVSSDLSVVSCTLNSAAHLEHPLMLFPMEVALPLVGERLWALGFRHNAVEDGSALVTPLVASGVVATAYPQGRGDRMPAICIEVGMDTWGGMSGGPVINARGNVIGIVSSSFDGGPSYVTLIWDVLRLRVRSVLPWAARRKSVSIVDLASLGSAKLIGSYRKFRRGDVVIQLKPEEMQLMVASSDPSEVRKSDHVFNDEEADQLLEHGGSDLERRLERAAIEDLQELAPSSVAWFIVGEERESSFPAIQPFDVEDFEGLEDLEVLSNRPAGEDCVILSCGFELLSVIWDIVIDEGDFALLGAEDRKCLNSIEAAEGVIKAQAIRRCYFECDVTYVPSTKDFTEIVVTAHGVIRSPYVE